jgi:hypothetical protein
MVDGEDKDDSRSRLSVGEGGRREGLRATAVLGRGRPMLEGGEGEEEVGYTAYQKEEGRERRPIGSFLFLFSFLFSFFPYLVILKWFKCNFKCSLNLVMKP